MFILKLKENRVLEVDMSFSMGLKLILQNSYAPKTYKFDEMDELNGDLMS